MIKTTFLTIAFVMVFTMRASGYAAYTWTGADSTDWNDSGNWTGPAGTFPDDGGDTATITGDGFPAHVNVGITVGSVTLDASAELFIDNGKLLKITSTDGLTIGNQATLDIEGGVLKLTGGGEIDIDDNGLITFSEENGAIVFGGDRPYYIATGPEPDPDPLKVIFTAPGESVVGTLAADDGSNPTFILQPDNAMTGVFIIKVRMVNNGWVEADRDGDITLDCQPKSGNGQWRITHADAKMVVNVPVTGGECSGLLVKQGTLDVNEHWVSCGNLEMDQSGGKIDVAKKVLFKMGTCAEACDCVPIG